MNLANIVLKPLRYYLRRYPFQCELCGFKTRVYRKVDSHVMLFPRCYWDAVDKKSRISTLSQDGPHTPGEKS